MILVADSGSSKTDWLLAVPQQEPLQFKTGGLNPYFLTEKEMVKILQSQGAELVAHTADITEIYFFGAGCSSPDRHEIVTNTLSQLFPKAYISVDSDLLGCAYATCGHEKGLCCVLGTGSNISFFDGEDIHSGKHLYGNMPADIHASFDQNYALNKEIVINHVYQQPEANSYLASFAKFLNGIRTTEYCQSLLTRGFQEFIDTNIKSYPQYHRYKSHFVGSIAFVFADELKALCAANEVQVGKIIKQPIFDLMQFIISRDA
jgi:glucosamine kinase